MDPVLRDLLQHFAHALLIDQELAGSHGAASPDAGGDDYELVRIRIDQASDDGVVLICSGFLLLGSIQNPSANPPMMDPILKKLDAIAGTPNTFLAFSIPITKAAIDTSKMKGNMMRVRCAVNAALS